MYVTPFIEIAKLDAEYSANCLKWKEDNLKLE